MTKQDDIAGALLGWSIGTGAEQRHLDELLEFPCVYNFKAVGFAEANFVENLLKSVELEIGRDIGPDEYLVRDSSAGKYQSITLRLYMTSAAEIYRVYAAIKLDERVKYIL